VATVALQQLHLGSISMMAEPFRLARDLIVTGEATVYFDGGCRPKNPGHAGIAVVVLMDNKQRILSRYIGIATNNYAEYTGLIVAVKYAKELGARKVELVSDSKLVVEQTNGKWKIKSEEMRPLVMEARNLLDHHFAGMWKLRHVRRTDNVKADYYCGLAIEAGRNRNPWHHPRKRGKILDPFSSAYELATPSVPEPA
jgi:ribonuclease HI